MRLTVRSLLGDLFQAFCQAYLQNAHLASIHTAEENNFIFILRGKLQDYHSGKAYWTGAHDLFKVLKALPYPAT